MVEFSSTCSSEVDTKCDYLYERNRECMVSALERHELRSLGDLTGSPEYKWKNVLGKHALETHGMSALLDHILNYAEL